MYALHQLNMDSLEKILVSVKLIEKKECYYIPKRNVAPAIN
jgi:hypothetical protein